MDLIDRIEMQAERIDELEKREALLRAESDAARKEAKRNAEDWAKAWKERDALRQRVTELERDIAMGRNCEGPFCGTCYEQGKAEGAALAGGGK